MKEEDRKKIDEIMGVMKCPQKFKCTETGFHQLCKARDLGLDKYVECLEENPPACSFALPFGSGHFCKCSLRVHLAKKVRRNGLN